MKLNTSSQIYSLKNEIKQVVLNILKNAEDAFIENNIKKREIIIKTFDKDNFTFLEISDNAGGIKNEYLHEICMSKTIIESHCKGKISVKNNDRNGASFTIKLAKK